MSGQGDSPTPVSFDVPVEHWTRVVLDDDEGVCVEVKPAVVRVRRMPGQDEQGRPIYEVTAFIATRVVPQDKEE